MLYILYICQNMDAIGLCIVVVWPIMQDRVSLSTWALSAKNVWMHMLQYMWLDANRQLGGASELWLSPISTLFGLI